MSRSLYLFDEEEYQPSGKKQKDAARLEIASLTAEQEENKTRKEVKKTTEENGTPPAEAEKSDSIVPAINPALSVEKTEEHTEHKKEEVIQEMLEEVVDVDPIPGFKSDKQYHTISEVAKLFGLNVSHIRHWTTEFNIRVRKNRKGDRLYTEANILELKKVYLLMMKKGHTIKGAKLQMQKPHALKREAHLKEILTDLHHQLQLLAKQLN